MNSKNLFSSVLANLHLNKTKVHLMKTSTDITYYMTLYWKMDNFEAACEFADGFVTFTEVNNPNLTWTLEWMP